MRIWGAVAERVVEITATPASPWAGIGILGLPPIRARTTRDRIRAALLGSCPAPQVPSALLRVSPPIEAGRADELDLPLALAVLAFGQRAPGSLFASGRLGLDGTIYRAAGHERIGDLREVRRMARQPYDVSNGTLARMARKQVIVQLDDALVQSLDNAAKKAGINRSELLRQAAFMWLQQVAEEELDRMYEDAYRRIPPGAEWDDNIAEWDPAPTGSKEGDAAQG